MKVLIRVELLFIPNAYTADGPSTGQVLSIVFRDTVFTHTDSNIQSFVIHKCKVSLDKDEAETLSMESNRIHKLCQTYNLAFSCTQKPVTSYSKWNIDM